jgi:hypothetical protein
MSEVTTTRQFSAWCLRRTGPAPEPEIKMAHNGIGRTFRSLSVLFVLMPALKYSMDILLFFSHFRAASEQEGRTQRCTAYQSSLTSENTLPCQVLILHSCLKKSSLPASRSLPLTSAHQPIVSLQQSSPFFILEQQRVSEHESQVDMLGLQRCLNLPGVLQTETECF